jgi:acetolactate synthase I/III small subunit
MKLIAPFGIFEFTRTGLMAPPNSPLYRPNDDLERDAGDLVDASTLPPR